MSSAHNPDVIERVADRMWRHRIERDRKRWGEIPGINFDPWDAISEHVRESVRGDARAALDAVDELYADEGGEVPHEP